MRDTLYIQLRDAPPDAAFAYALTGSQPGLGITAQHDTLDRILGLAAGRRVVLFVPGLYVRLASVVVPARQPQKILQAAPYALEDQLAEDVETLHFAITPNPQRRKAGEPQPVAVVARARMDAWLAPFTARGVHPDAVVPETLALPLPEGAAWTAIAEGSHVIVRSGAFGGFACALDDLGSYLALVDPDAQVPLRLFVAHEVEYDFSRLGRPVELLPGHGSALEVLVRHWRPEQSINLLQGAYSAAEDWRRLARPWRAAVLLAGAWVIVAFAAQAAHAIRLSGELKRQEQANVKRYQALFPNDTRIVDLAAQTQQQLSALRAGAARAPLFQLLDALSAALAANAGLTLQSLQFREGALYLSLTGTDLAALESLRTWFAGRRDALLEVQAANAGSEGVQIRLKLTLA